MTAEIVVSPWRQVLWVVQQPELPSLATRTANLFSSLHLHRQVGCLPTMEMVPSPWRNTQQFRMSWKASTCQWTSREAYRPLWQIPSLMLLESQLS